jgi:hypothetical protein
MNEKHRNKKREELLAWFRREAKPLAESYEAAVRLLEDKTFPDRIPLIAHELREINNSLPEILDPMSKRARVEYEERLNEISPNWSTVPSLESAKIGNSSEKPVTIDINVALQIDALVQDHRKSQQPFNHFGILFRILMRNHPLQADVNLEIIQDFKNLHRKFVKWSKKRTLMKQPIDEKELRKQFSKFEDILHSFVGSFFEGTERLDELLKRGVQPDQIDEIFTLIASPHHQAYFFNNLNDHNLIPFLKKKGMFESPFKTEPLKGGGIRFPVWPPSRYLARMTPTSPDEVSEIFSKMETDNASVVQDIVSAALSAPAKTARKLVPKICRAAENNLLVLCSEDAGTLCVKLAEEGDAQSAELLAIALFTPRKKNFNRSSWDEHQYREGLEKVIATLAPVSTSSTFLEKLCVWMQLFIESEKRFDPESGNDYSFVWRRAIEDHAENLDYHRASPMVAFIRDGFELSIENKKMSIDKAFEILDRQKYLVFKRIKLHLINKFAEQNPNIAKVAILNRDFFEQDEYKHEYAKLVENRFSLLNESERQEWFFWTKNGPSNFDLKDLKSNASEEQISRGKRYWRYRRLNWIKDYFTGSHKTDYESLKEEFGDLTLLDLNTSSYSGMIESPINTEDLSKLSFKEAVKTVTEWRPNSQSLSGIEELANAFQEYVNVQPVAFSRESKELISYPLIFISKFIGAMSLAIKMGSDIKINAVLDLCLWAASFPSDSTNGHVDKYWSWARSEIALFMKAVCQATEGHSPKYSMEEFRTRLWQIINCLCLIKDDAIFLVDKDEDPRSEDYVQIAINSPKGQAMEATLEYARWVFNHFKQLPNKADRAEFTEVMRLMESLLFAEDRTPGELAMIGANIHLLYVIDKFWLEKYADAIFPLESNEFSPSGLEWAAWNAFLSNSHPHIEFYRLFKKQFTFAVNQAPFIQSPKKGSANNPAYRLGEHLIILYMRRELLLDDEELSLRRFLSEGTSDVRRHTIEFIGRVLQHHSEISEGVEKRCIELWELYWKDNGDKDAHKECGSWPFVSWLTCRKFPKKWCLEQFERYCQANKNPEISSWAMEELTWISDVDFKKSVNILDAIVRSDKEGWHIPGWLDSIHAILEAALKKDCNCSQSRQLIDFLGRSGYMKFRELALQ